MNLIPSGPEISVSRDMNERRPQTMKSFQCRDHLWRLFSFVAEDLGCSVDYLINESMREYARGRGYSITEAMRMDTIDAGTREGLDSSNDVAESYIGPPEPIVYPKRLFVVLDGVETEVVDSPFVIGRGNRVTNLRIPDTNVSRRHCVVEKKDGQYTISDLGSTNGIEIGGLRVQSQVIEQNMSVYICDYELRFLFR